MSLSELITSNLNFAIEQIATSLTAVSPTNNEVYIASKQNVSGGFSIFDEIFISIRLSIQSCPVRA